MGLKRCAIGKHPWGTHWEPREHIGNLMKPIGNLKGTFWEQRKIRKNTSPSSRPQPKLKRKKSQGTLRAC